MSELPAHSPDLWSRSYLHFLNLPVCLFSLSRLLSRFSSLVSLLSFASKSPPLFLECHHPLSSSHLLLVFSAQNPHRIYPSFCNIVASALRRAEIFDSAAILEPPSHPFHERSRLLEATFALLWILHFESEEAQSISNPSINPTGAGGAALLEVVLTPT